MCCFFYRRDATTEVYTLSLHDALPICRTCAERSTNALRRVARRRSDAVALPDSGRTPPAVQPARPRTVTLRIGGEWTDRKSTRLNSSHTVISYAVFCLKKKKKTLRFIN